MLLAALLLAQLLFYSIPLVLVKKPFFTLVVEWVASIQYRGVSLLLLLVPAALPSHSQTCVLVFYLQICILRSLTTLGIAITWVRVFPLQKHATLINSLLVNASVLGEDESREGVWDRWMRALRVKSSKEEDWNKQLQVEWARLCMLIEELCVCVSCVCEGRVRVAFVRGSDLSIVDKQQS